MGIVWRKELREIHVNIECDCLVLISDLPAEYSHHSQFDQHD